ncbi:MAG: hypothetical protein JWN32_925 [Solirubrobacterales bacterium]|nr:hypothetical protein [Solirubrobacterales bacterium]
MALTGYGSVQAWMEAAGFAEDDERIAVLEAFCVTHGATPDEMVDQCLRRFDDGQLKLRMKARREWVSRIDAFEASGGRRQANILRSFFVQNGIPIQPPITW